MNQIERDMMLSMVNLLNEASSRYYNSGEVIMSDKEFDMRLADLKQLEKETGVIFSNSPSINVGAPVLTELKETEHKYPMLSLDKCHSVNEIIEFANNKELVASIKLDGCSVALTYEDGVLTKAETRGNGHIGNDITEHIKRFTNVPLKINKENTYLIYGEAIIDDEDFAEINKNNEFKNSRNLCAGTLSVLDTSLVAKRKLRFIAWDVIEGSSNSLKDNLAEAKELGFEVVPFWYVVTIDPKKFQNTVDYVFNFAKEEGLPCDGIVFKFDDIEYGKSLGSTGHHFKNGIAYKRADDTYETEFLGIDWTLGKSGTITPTAVFKDVEIDGTTVSRASVHNISILTQLDLHKGDIIEVFKAGMIIPQVKRNVSSDKRKLAGVDPDYIMIPSTCPICGGETKLVTENDSTILVCTNDNCKGKLLGKLTHFVSKNAMNIENLSEATLEKFIELGYVNSFADIYELKSRFYENIIKLDGFGKKSVDKLMNAIEASKVTTLDRFLYSLSIPLIGKSASKTIAKHFDYNFERFYTECMCYDGEFDFKVLDDFGDAMSESVNNYFDKYSEDVCILARYLGFKHVQDTNSNSKLSGKTFVITGSLNHFANRDEAKEKIESMGGKVAGSVSAKTSYLVNNDINSTSGKNKKAIELGIKIISENELIEMLNN